MGKDKEELKVDLSKYPIKGRFVEILEESKLLQSELADELGISQGTVSSTINAPREFSKFSYLVALQKLTGCDANYIITGQGARYLKDYPLPPYIQPDEIAILNDPSAEKDPAKLQREIYRLRGKLSKMKEMEEQQGQLIERVKAFDDFIDNFKQQQSQIEQRITGLEDKGK